MEALRQVASRQTVRSVKETLLATILIHAVREQRQRPRWRTRLAVPTAVLLTAFHSDIWQHLIHLLH